MLRFLSTARRAVFLLVVTVAVLTHDVRASCPHPSGSQKILPGLDGTLGRGIDLSRFSFPLAGGWASQDIGTCVVSISLDENYTWNDQYTNETVLIWDQVDGVTAFPSYFESSAGFVLDTMESFMEWISISESDSGLFGAFSSSESFSEFFSLGYSNNATLFMVRGTESAYYATLLEPSQLEPDASFLKDVSALPPLWELPLAWKAWVEHFSEYGTHYIWRAYFGGNYFYGKFVDVQFMSQYGQAAMSAQGSIDFLNFLSMDGGGSAQAQEASSDYVQAGTAYVSCFGCAQEIGYCHNQRNNSAQFDEWINCAARSPYMYNASFRINSNLLPRGALRDNHLLATTTYIGWSGVQWMANAISSARDIFKRVAGWPDPATLNCACSPEWPGSGIPPCSRWEGGSADVYAHVHSSAQTMLNRTEALLVNVTAALDARNKSLILPALSVLNDWMARTLDVTKVAFSGPPQFLQCGSAPTMPAHQGDHTWCDEQCCWSLLPGCSGPQEIVCFSGYAPLLLTQ